MGEPGVVDWSTVDWSTRSDSQIAEDLGVSRQAVHRARRSLGIAPRAPGRKGLQVDWREVGLGTQPDREIAARLGCSNTTVAAARERLGIPPCGKRRPRSARVVPTAPGPAKPAPPCVDPRRASEERVARSLRWARRPLDEDEVAARSGVPRYAVLTTLRAAEERGLVRRVGTAWEAAL